MTATRHPDLTPAEHQGVEALFTQDMTPLTAASDLATLHRRTAAALVSKGWAEPVDARLMASTSSVGTNS